MRTLQITFDDSEALPRQIKYSVWADLNET